MAVQLGRNHQGRKVTTKAGTLLFCESVAFEELLSLSALGGFPEARGCLWGIRSAVAVAIGVGCRIGLVTG